MPDVSADCTQHDDGWTCEVTVAAAKTSEHTVEVPREDYEELTGATEIDVEDLLVQSFEFLLEREPQGAIMSRFDLMTIETYFPSYPDEIPRNR